MLTNQYSFPSATARQHVQYALGSIALYLILSMVWAFSTDATWDDDCPTRVFNTLEAFAEPEHFISPWNRPLFVLLFALPLQLGFWTVPVLMALISAGGAWLLYKAMEKWKVPHAWLVVPLYLFQPYAFVIAHNALTEPLAMNLIALGIWAHAHGRWGTFGWAGGFLVLARLELAVALPLWAWVLWREKQLRHVVGLAVPLVAWNVAGGLMTGDWTYVFSETFGRAEEESRYGQTPPTHYLERYLYVVGPISFFFLLLGLAMRIARKRVTVFLDMQFVGVFLAYVLISWQLAAGNAAGFLRNLIPLTPFVALISLEGFNTWLGSMVGFRQTTAPAKETRWIVGAVTCVSILLALLVYNRKLEAHMLFTDMPFLVPAVFLVTVGAAWLILGMQMKPAWVTPKWGMNLSGGVMGLMLAYTVTTEPPGNNDNLERQIVREIGQQMEQFLSGNTPIYANHIWYYWSQQLDRNDPRFREVTMANLEAAPMGAIVLWDLHYSPRLGGDVRHDYFDTHKEWTELLRYRSVEAKFMGMVFQKGMGLKEYAFKLSDKYLERHRGMPQAHAAAGNVHLRWADFTGAIPHFNQAIAGEGDNADNWYGLGLAQLSARQAAEALKAFSRAAELDPEFPNAWFQLGSARVALGDHRGAVSDFTQAIRLQPTYATAYFARGACYGRMGDMRAAEQDFTKALELDPADVPARFNRGVTYAALRQHEAAVADLKVALRAMPNNADGWMFLGRSELALRRVADACTAFGKADALGQPRAKELIGKYCMALGQ